MDATRFRPRVVGQGIRTELGIGRRALLIGMIARLTTGRGHDGLLKACERLFEKAPWVTVVLPGDGELRDELRAEVERRNWADRVLFPRIDPKRWDEFLNALDLSVFLAEGSDGSARAVLEVMACGKPTVAARVGVVPEIVEDGYSGLHVPPDDPDALAAALVRLSVDEPLRLRFGRRARLLVEDRHALETRAKRVEEVYRLAIAERL